MRLTEQQAKRLQDLLAFGPLDRRPVDYQLIKLGWAQLYDGQLDAVEAHDNAARDLYDSSGRIKDELLPEAWK